LLGKRDLFIRFPLLNEEAEKGAEIFTDKNLRDTMLNIVIAGWDITTVTLSWLDMPDEGPMKFSLAMISSCDAQSESFQDHQVWIWIVHRDAISVDLQVFTKSGFNEDYLSDYACVWGEHVWGWAEIRCSWTSDARGT
jgi:hypothetical protein